jgi:NADPH:quinone reductase
LDVRRVDQRRPGSKIRNADGGRITGALGAVGQAATQIAHWKKAKVIGSDISDKTSEADAFVNAKSKDLSVEVKALTDGKGVDLVLDAVGGPMFEPCLAVGSENDALSAGMAFSI